MWCRSKCPTPVHSCLARMPVETWHHIPGGTLGVPRGLLSSPFIGTSMTLLVSALTLWAIPLCCFILVASVLVFALAALVTFPVSFTSFIVLLVIPCGCSELSAAGKGQQGVYLRLLSVFLFGLDTGCSFLPLYLCLGFLPCRQAKQGLLLLLLAVAGSACRKVYLHPLAATSQHRGPRILWRLRLGSRPFPAGT